MTYEVGMAAEAMTEKDKQILEHLEQAQRLDVPLTEYAHAYNVELKERKRPGIPS